MSWINSNCLGADSKSESCYISLIRAPERDFSDHSIMESSTLPALIAKYTNEVLHNIYCSRLFVWEQVGLIMKLTSFTIYGMFALGTVSGGRYPMGSGRSGI